MEEGSGKERNTEGRWGRKEMVRERGARENEKDRGEECGLLM